MATSIITGLPNNVRRPGAFSSIKFNASPLLALNELRAVIVAEKSAAGTAAADTPIQVFGADDADLKAGMGSFGALGCRKALDQAMLMGGAMPETWLAPLAEPGGGAKATITLTVTVTTALAGNIPLRIAGRSIPVPVNAGDAQNTIAAAIAAAIQANVRILPGTAAAATNVVTFTVATKGVNGNDVVADLIGPLPGGVTVAIAAGVAGTGVTVITTAIQSLYDQRYHAVCVANHTTTDIATLLAERAAAWGYSQQNYRHFFMGCRDSLGTAQTLATAANDFGIVVGTYEGTPSLPIEIAVADAYAEFATTVPNVNMDGQRVALYPPSATLAYTTSEIESALGGGLTPHVPDGSFSKIVRMMTTEVTLDGVSTETVRDIAFSRVAAYRAELHESNFRVQFKQEIIDADTLPRIQAMQIGLDRAMEAQRILVNVDSRIDQYVVQLHSSVPGRVQSSSPFTPAGPLHQLDAVHVMYLQNAA